MVIESSRLKGRGKGRYKKLKHVVFIHWLAADKLNDYKFWLVRYLKTKNQVITPETPILLSTRSEDIEKLGSVNPIFEEASLRAWQDLEKKRFSPQDVRDFLQSALESAGIHSNIIAPMLSHKVRGVEFHYSSHEIQELLEKFRAALPWLVPQTVEQVKAESEKKLSKQENTLTHLEYENTELKDKINHLRTEMKEGEDAQKVEIEKLQNDYKSLQEKIDTFLKHFKTL